ncbi:hypothetical protein ACFQ14_12590 [Pseudahrensia aquimaris]|uniref:Uncharacterized protein n=1 Tax=Pseudahrensia aquimaris TaxID=744461 RepID=A0ABW3FJ51_9HYPH
MGETVRSFDLHALRIFHERGNIPASNICFDQHMKKVIPMKKNNDPKTAPRQLPKKKYPELDRWAVPVLSLVSGALLGVATPNLIDAEGISGIVKVGLLAGGASISAFCVNRIAIDKGTDLASRGYVTAGAASLFSVLFVGAGLFTSTLAGLTLPKVEKLRLAEHAQSYVLYIGERNTEAAKAGRTLPVVRAINRELPAKAACEIKISCVSGRGNGGYGTVARVLEEMAGRAGNVAEQVETGELTRQAKLKSLNALVGEYQEVLDREDSSLKEKRVKLQRIDAQIVQTVSELDEAIPVSFLRSYAEELSAGFVIANNSGATTRLNALLGKHGQSLKTVLETLEPRVTPRPVFPREAGVSDTLAYIGHFIPIAMLTAVVEVIFPVCLWIYTLVSLLWGHHVAVPDRRVEDGDSAKPNGKASNFDQSEEYLAAQARAVKTRRSNRHRQREDA